MTLAEQCNRARELYSSGKYKRRPIDVCFAWSALLNEAAGEDCERVAEFIGRAVPGQRFESPGLEAYVFQDWANNGPSDVEVLAVLGRACVMAKSLEDGT